MEKIKDVFIKELKNFSKGNWWVYIVLFICLGIVYITGKGNITEIIILFIANFLGNLFIMIMQDFYTAGKNKKGAINQLISVSIFTSLSIYGLISSGQYQYIIWQFMYILAAMKTFGFFIFEKDLKLLNENVFLVVNFILFFVFIRFIPHDNFHLLQALGFSMITSGLVSIKDKVRYWLNLFGIAALTAGSLWGVIVSYISASLDGIALGFFLLTGTVFVFYIKILPNYLKKVKVVAEVK
ncbi:hypothetical protein EOM39_00590 [Candidatus Gracilibacteria bacterium]|nr:hypothetical protein [Candidatus Gracilibacteria bacterium]